LNDVGCRHTSSPQGPFNRRGLPANAYSTEIAGILANQLTKFVSLNPHQLAGQIANLDFWLDEVRHSLAVIDGYHHRFKRLNSAQMDYTSKHQTQQFVPGQFHETATDATKPRRVPGNQLSDSRRALCDATYRFLIRCFRAGLLSEKRVRDECNRLDIGFDVRDFGR